MTFEQEKNIIYVSVKWNLIESMYRSTEDEDVDENDYGLCRNHK